MGHTPPRAEQRAVVLETAQGPVEGTMTIGASSRTLDDLNVSGASFVILRSPKLNETSWSLGTPQVMVSKASILFLRETGPPPPVAASRPSAGTRFSRATLRLRVGEFDVEGFVHVPPGGSAVARLNQEHPMFISLTSVSVSGKHTQFAAPFLAVNRRYIVAAEELLQTEEADEDIELNFELVDKQ